MAQHNIYVDLIIDGKLTLPSNNQDINNYWDKGTFYNWKSLGADIASWLILDGATINSNYQDSTGYSNVLINSLNAFYANAYSFNENKNGSITLGKDGNIILASNSLTHSGSFNLSSDYIGISAFGETVPITLFSGNRVTIQSKDGLELLGLNANSYSGFLKTGLLTANRNYQLPNLSGTIAVQEWVTQQGFITAIPVATNSVLGTVKVGSGLTIDGSGLLSVSNSGSVTSVGLTMPTGFAVTNSPVTSAGTLTVAMAAGYQIPTTTNINNWNTAYGWGNHANAGYLNYTPNLQQITQVGSTTTGTLTANGIVMGFSLAGYLGFDSNSPYAFLAGGNAAQKIYTGGVLASDGYVDASLIPSNGIYSKGLVKSGTGFAVTNGQSYQFLKADGSVDSSSYVSFFASGNHSSSDNFNNYLNNGNINITSSGYWYQNAAGVQADKHPQMHAGAMISSTGLYGEYRQLYFDNLGQVFTRGQYEGGGAWNRLWGSIDFNSADIGKLKTLWQPTTRARYIKVSAVDGNPIPGSVPTLYFGLAEIEVYSGGVNVALNKPVSGTSTEYNGQPMSFINDGTIYPWGYYAATNNGYIVIDLGQEYDITEIKTFYGAFGNLNYCDVHYSLDNVSYSKYASFATVAENITLSFFEVSARKWNANNYIPTLTNYSAHANADSDTALLSGQLYQLTGDRAVYRKP